MTVYVLIARISQFSNLLPLIASFEKNAVNWLYQPVRFFVITSIIAEVLNRYSAEIFKTNILVFNFYWLMEFIVVVWFFKRLFKQPKLLYVQLAGLVLYLGFQLTVDHYNTLISPFRTITLVSILPLIILGFFQLMRAQIEAKLSKNPLFWVLLSFSVFFIGNIFNYIFSDYLNKNYNDLFQLTWIVHNIFDVVKNLMIAYAFLLNARTELKTNID